MLVQAPKTTIIRQLNDQFRRTLAGGRILLTPTIVAVDEQTRAAILKRTTEFNDFTTPTIPLSQPSGFWATKKPPDRGG